jgi:hypothetical protein
MSVHGVWCSARTFPMRCRYCSADVFYFSCNCGSKVFFDDLGGDWPIHDCATHVVAQVRVAIEEKYARRLAERKRPKTWAPPIVALQPAGNERVEDLGIVREVCAVDVYKRFRVPRDGGLAPAFLGRRLTRSALLQVTVHTGGLSADQLHSYTFLVAKAEWEKKGVRQGDLVLFAVQGCRTPGGDGFWEYRRLALPS